jgi:hypothetical protein
MLKDNPEKRSCARLNHQAQITLESYEVGLMHEARMFNYSKSGLYFESDFYLVPGTEIYIGMRNSPYSPSAGVYECYRSVIKWRKFLESSAFDYGYGIEIKGRVPCRPKPGKAGESRKHPRTSCAIPTVIQSNGRKTHGVIQNVSYGGVFISCFRGAVHGTACFLTIPLKKKQKLITRTAKSSGATRKDSASSLRSRLPTSHRLPLSPAAASPTADSVLPWR